MGESTQVIPRTDEADAEVELSAQELLALSDVRPTDDREAEPTLKPPRPAASASPRKLDPLQALARRYVGASRASGSLIVIGCILGTAYLLTTSGHATQSTANTSQRTARSESPPSEQIAQKASVRFANPFDTEEVFEFPPGTTETEARDAVARVLIERAMSRQKT